MLKRNYLASNSVYLSYAHKKRDLKKYLLHFDKLRLDINGTNDPIRLNMSFGKFINILKCVSSRSSFGVRDSELILVNVTDKDCLQSVG